MALVGNSTSASFVDANATVGSTYYYAVGAVNAAGEGGHSATVSAYLTLSTLPLTGKIVDANGNGMKGITVALENGTSVQTDDQGNFEIMASPGQPHSHDQRPGHRNQDGFCHHQLGRIGPGEHFHQQGQ